MPRTRQQFRHRLTSTIVCSAMTAAAIGVLGAAPASAASSTIVGSGSAHRIVQGFGPTLPGISHHTATTRPPSAPLAPKTGPSCNPAFSQVSSGNSGNIVNELESVTMLNPQDGWAAGFNSTGVAGSERTLAVRYDGTTWKAVATPNLGNGVNQLWGVTASDPNDVWAVGDYFNSASQFNLAIHWNGSGWSAPSVPQPAPAGGQVLLSVSAVSSSNVWAVGTYINNASVAQAMALQWNGSTWTQATVPQPSPGQVFFRGVFARSATDVWATGYYTATNATPPAVTTNPWLSLVEHYDGTSWSIVTSANPVAGNFTLPQSISASSATDAWMVGVTFDGTKYQTVTERLVTGQFVTVPSFNESTSANSLLTGVDDISPNNVWAVGYGTTNSSPGASSNSLAEHFDGASWTQQLADIPGGANGDGFLGVASLPGNDLFGVGGVNTSSTNESTLVQQFQLPGPTSVVATPGDQSASVAFVAPLCDGGFTTTSYIVTAADGCAVVATATGATSPITVSGLTNGSPLSFTVQAQSASLGDETPSMPSAFVTPTGLTVPTAESACVSRQFSKASPDPVNFVDIDPGGTLTLNVTPTVDSTAVLSGNSDLWTANAGLNQDIGIFVSGGAFGAGQIVGWKESGGFAGTFSPNAAAVQAVATFIHGTTYTMKLQWKGNKPFPGATMFAGAGPVEGDFRLDGAGAQGFSQTRLSLHLTPSASNTVLTAPSNQQYKLTSSNGTTFTDIDSVNLSKSVPVAVDSMAVITGNVDLWTANAGFNQDVGIFVSGGTFAAGQIVSWKESGGFAGTFSPNAAFVQVLVPLPAAGSPYTVKLQWKTNKNAPGATIFAGAGPWPSGTTTYSPTRLTVSLVPLATPSNQTTITSQPTLGNSDGAGWTPIGGLQTSFTPSLAGTYAVSGNVDLWTANAGFNQDVGLFISGGQFGSGTLIAWKESGGFAGTFSPNAAFVEANVHLAASPYTLWLAWKTNKPGAGSTIFAGAGPWPGGTTSFSPTRLTDVQLSTP